MSQPPPWRPVTRIAFRLGFVYFTLFLAASQVAGSLLVLPGVDFPGLGALAPFRPITFWTARVILAVAAPLDAVGADGETAFFLAQTLWMSVFAVAIAAAWSLLDRRRPDYRRLHAWFRVLVRLGLAATMIEYGMTKIIPIQFRAPSLATLVTPAGDLSLDSFFWTSIGASQAYQMFTGWAELVAGLLLLAGRTTLIGAGLCLADTIHVFVLNMSYDIPLKLTSLHLVALCLVLLAPDFRRLADFSVLGRQTAPARARPLFPRPGANRLAAVAQIVFGLYLIAMQASANLGYWQSVGRGAPKSLLYGIWDVRMLEVDGEARPVALNDYDRRLRRVIFDTPGEVRFQRTDDSFARYGAVIDAARGRLTLSKGTGASWRAEFRLERPADGVMRLDGMMDGHDLGIELVRRELDTFRLLNSHFRWLRPPPSP